MIFEKCLRELSWSTKTKDKSISIYWFFHIFGMLCHLCIKLCNIYLLLFKWWTPCSRSIQCWMSNMKKVDLKLNKLEDWFWSKLDFEMVSKLPQRIFMNLQITIYCLYWWIFGICWYQFGEREIFLLRLFDSNGNCFYKTTWW